MDIRTREIRNSITPEILKLIAEIDEFEGHWKVMESLAPEKLTSLRRIATIAGNRIEFQVCFGLACDKCVDDVFRDRHGRLLYDRKRRLDSCREVGLAASSSCN